MKGTRELVQQLVKKLLLSALLILCAPLGFHHAKQEPERESNCKAVVAETSPGQDLKTSISGESLEISSTNHATNFARQLRMIPLASHVLFLKEYSEIEE